MKKIICAKTAGFCYGVRRAVDMAEAEAGSGRFCVMLGPIIHNAHMIGHLAGKGIGCVETVEQIPEGAAAIIRSHGEGKPVYRQLEQRNIPVIDATCPNVAKIHQLISDAEARGRRPVIIGTKTHPEVLAIAAWCENPLVFESAEDFNKWLEEAPERREIPITMVSQTTSTQDLFHSCEELAKKECTNIEIFDTICNATFQRQKEAGELAKRCDAVVVIGDRKSSNTKRLTEICSRICPTVLWIEQAGELDLNLLRNADVVGITAGASTPEWIIKEVLFQMDEEIKGGEESFAELLEQSFKTLNTGEKVSGVVTAITPTEIHVDLGTKQAGYIPVSELTDDPTADISSIVKVGDPIETFVMRVNDVEGVVTLSKKRLDTVKSWDDIEVALENQTPVEGFVTEENKGGIVVSVRGVRVFVPASRTGLPKDADLSSLVKTKVRLRITEVNRARRRVVGSIRALQYEERRAAAEKIWNEIEPGKQYNGTVKSLTSYGAFVDIGGVDGMVHISELTWGRIKHPSEVVKVGDSVDVYVISVDKEKKKISLGMKNRSEDPWEKFIGSYSVGSIVNVKVVKLMTFGAFAEIIPGVDGLIHISQIANRRIEKPGDVLSEGQRVDVKITEINTETHKISLSIRALLNAAGETEKASDEQKASEPDEVVAVSSEEETVIKPSIAEEEAQAAE